MFYLTHQSYTTFAAYWNLQLNLSYPLRITIYIRPLIGREHFTFVVSPIGTLLAVVAIVEDNMAETSSIVAATMVGLKNY